MKLFKRIHLKRMHTQVRIGGLAELSPSTETEIKRQLVRLAQLTSILNRCEGIVGVVISHKAIVVPVADDQKFSSCSFSVGEERVATGLAHRFEM